MPCGTSPRVPPARVPDSDLELVARAIETGRRQTKVAEELGWTQSKVKRCLNTIRTLLAAEEGAVWLDTTERSAPEVAREWLRLRAERS
jgi:predicted transcriptional regulator